MRIHSASSRIEPSLKFDVNLISLPSSIYTQMEPWENDPDSDRRIRLGVYAEKYTYHRSKGVKVVELE